MKRAYNQPKWRIPRAMRPGVNTNTGRSRRAQALSGAGGWWILILWRPQKWVTLGILAVTKQPNARVWMAKRSWLVRLDQT